MSQPYTSFIDETGLQGAFLANRLSRLVDLIVDQGDVLLQTAGICFPARASSTILMIKERGAVTTADIARELDQPHQLATQRVTALQKLGLLKRQDDPEDARRKTLILTAKGKRQAETLCDTLQSAQSAFQDLFLEIEIDLDAVVRRTMTALSERPLEARVNATKQDIQASDLGEHVKSSRRSGDA